MTMVASNAEWNATKLAIASAGLLSAAVGAITLFGWANGRVDLVRPTDDWPVLTPTAAACLTALGAGLTAHASGRRRLAFTGASASLVMSLVAAGGYLLGMDNRFNVIWHALLGIDLDTFPSIALNTVIGLTLASIAAMLGIVLPRSERATAAAGILAVVAGALGGVALFGYMSGLEGAYEWANFYGMSPQAALALVALGATLALAPSLGELRRTGSLPRWTAVAVGLAGAVGAIGLWAAIDTQRDATIVSQVDVRLEATTELLRETLAAHTRALEKMAAQLAASDYTAESWTTDATIYREHLQGLGPIGVFDDALSVRWMLAPTSNPFHPDRALNALVDARTNRAPVIRWVGAPQASAGLVVAAPAYAGPIFVGGVAAMLDAEGLTTSVLRQFVPRYFAVDFRAGGRALVPKDTNADVAPGAWQRQKSFTFAGVDWSVLVTPRKVILEQSPTSFPRQVLAGGIMIALLAALLTEVTGRSMRRRREAELATERLSAEIAQRQAAEAALLESRERLELAIDVARIGVFSWNPRTGETYLSPVYKAQLGYDDAELPNSFESWKERLHPEDRATTLDQLDRFLGKNGPALEMEFRLRHRNGSYRWILARALLVETNDLHSARLLGVHLDITHRRLSEERFRSLLEAAPDAVLITDKLGNIVLMNPELERLFGYSRKELHGQQVELLIPERLRTAHVAQRERFATSPELRPMGRGRELLGRKKDGTEFPIEVSLSPCHLPEGMLVTAAIRDASARKAFEKELQDAKEAADAASRAKSDFLAQMSHEIRTPLGAVLGFAELLALETTSERDREYASSILRNGRGLLALLNDILDLSKVESGKLEIERQPLDLAPFLAEVREQMQVTAREKGLSLALSLSGPVPEQIETDELRLRQILINVIGNAIKFTDHGGVSVNVSSVARGAVGDPRCAALQIDVQDSGCGIAAQNQEKIFTPFTQAERYISRRYGGTGLGLPLSRRLARALGGDLVLSRSVPGEGSVFTITVDTGRVAADARTIEEPSAITSGGRALKIVDDGGAQRLAGRSILVVEDFEDNQLIIGAVLKRHGALVAFAANGAEGVEKALGGDFDVVLMDVQMPVMNGYEATHELREKGFTLPIVALTAHAMRGHHEQCLKNGFSGYVAKPVKAEELVRIVESMLDRDASVGARPGPLVSTLAGDASLGQAIAVFAERLPARTAALRVAVEAADWQGSATLAHQLIGAGGMAGYQEITDVAREIEEAAYGEPPDAARIREKLAELDALVTRILLGRGASRKDADAVLDA